MIEQKICAQCGNAIWRKAKPSDLAAIRFCNIQCFNRSRIKHPGLTKKCRQCGKKIMRDSKHNITYAQWAKTKYCSVKCTNEARSHSDDTRTVILGGFSMRLTQACKLRKISYKIVDQRLREGWPLEKALTQ